MLNNIALVSTMRLNGHNQMEITIQGTEENMDDYSIDQKIIELGVRAYRYIRGSKEVNEKTGEICMSYIEEAEELWLEDNTTEVNVIDEVTILRKEVGDISSICIVCGRVKYTSECVCQIE